MALNFRLRFRVTGRSASLDGVGSPDGWLWTRIAVSAPTSTAWVRISFTISGVNPPTPSRPMVELKWATTSPFFLSRALNTSQPGLRIPCIPRTASSTEESFWPTRETLVGVRMFAARLSAL